MKSLLVIIFLSIIFFVVATFGLYRLATTPRVLPPIQQGDLARTGFAKALVSEVRMDGGERCYVLRTPEGVAITCDFSQHVE